MTANQFYEQLLDEIAVSPPDMKDARDKRDEIGTKVVAVVRPHLGDGVRFIPAGALAQGAQIGPGAIHDVDGVVEVPALPVNWASNPQQAMQDVRSWLEPILAGNYELGTHAIKITFPDEDFTADVVVGIKQQRGMKIPHCPKGEPHRWIATDPETHKKQVAARNAAFAPGRAIFSRQIRILKWLNQMLQMQNGLPRKPLASFHITALALEILKAKDNHANWTPLFLERASELVLQPLDDPAGVGEPLIAKNPAQASQLIAEAGRKTRAALTAADPEPILREVFGDPKKIGQIVTQQSVPVAAGGALASATAAPVRHSIPVRHHGDGS
jgi:hypothetical protein